MLPGESHIKMETQFAAEAILIVQYRISQVKFDRSVQVRHLDAQTVADADVHIAHPIAVRLTPNATHITENRTANKIPDGM